MSIDRGMDKEDVIIFHYDSAIKKNEIMPFAEAGMDLESVRVKSEKENHILCNIIYIQNLEKW